MTGDSSQFQTVGNQLIGSGNKQTTAGSGNSWVQKAHQVIAASKQSLVNAAPVLDSMDGAVKGVVDAADPFTPVVDSAAAMQNGDFTGVVVEGAGLTTRKFQFVNDIWSWVKKKVSKFQNGSSSTNGTGNTVKEGIYEFTDTTGKKYCGQSCNIPNRLKQHIREGKLDPNQNVTTTEVLGGKTAREIAEHKRIQGITGGVPARFSDKVSNKVDPIGPNRRYLLDD